MSSTSTSYLGRSAWLKGRGRGTVIADHGNGYVDWMPHNGRDRADAVRIRVNRLTFTRGR